MNNPVSFPCRKVAEKAWSRQLEAALTSVAEVASRDEKHGPRIKLENYVVLQRAFRSNQERQVRVKV